MKLKSRELIRKLRIPIRIQPLDKFYKNHWLTGEPTSEYFSNRESGHFFFSPDDRIRYAEELKRNFPDSCDQVMKRALDVLSNKFNILGIGDIDLGDDIDWGFGYKTGYNRKGSRFTEIKLTHAVPGNDIKIPWELSRLQFITDIGRAYWISGDNKYPQKFKSIIIDWERKNPFAIGVNWTYSMEVAIRAINIIWGLHFFARADGIDDAFIKNVIRLLYYHGLHIERNLEIIDDGANTNHLVADFIGLLYLGILFPEFDRAGQWKRMAIGGLQREMETQVYRDGADYECSTSYHRLKLEMFLSAFILGRLNGIEFNADYREKLHRMIQFSAAISPHSGHVPLIGDNDDGFIVKLSTSDPSNHLPLVDVGHLVFGELVPGEIPISEERLWFLGADSLSPFSGHPTPKSKWFKASGYIVIRNHRMHMVFNAINVPHKATGGHKHNDLLSFTLEIDRVPFLIDPGTFCYSADHEMRNISRSTKSHNTVSIDGREQNRYFKRHPFYLFRDAMPKVNLWVNAGSCSVVSASHDGYWRLNDHIVHKRTIWVSMANHTLLLLDEFTGKPDHQHTFDIRFITPIKDIERIGETSVAIRKDRARSLTIGSLNGQGMKLKIIDAHYYPSYGVKEPSAIIEFSSRSRLPFSATTMISYESRMVGDGISLDRAGVELKDRFQEMGLGVV